jgi:hypothetical protein
LKYGNADSQVLIAREIALDKQSIAAR